MKKTFLFAWFALLSIGAAAAAPADGPVKTFYPGGQIKEEKNYKAGKLDGTYKAYYDNGALQQEVPYENGLIQGVAKKYYPDGKPELESTYKNGRKHGPRRQYYKTSGRLYVDQNFTDDLQNGTEIAYTEEGFTEWEIHFVKGKKDGRMIVYQRKDGAQGTPMFETEYRADKKHGVSKTYDMFTGKLAKTERYEDDVLVGS
jgi:antitoxin component YwqK of YwqJK toxin-antitoxin module